MDIYIIHKYIYKCICIYYICFNLTCNIAGLNLSICLSVCLSVCLSIYAHQQASSLCMWSSLTETLYVPIIFKYRCILLDFHSMCSLVIIHTVTPHGSKFHACTPTGCCPSNIKLLVLNKIVFLIVSINISIVLTFFIFSTFLINIIQEHNIYRYKFIYNTCI